MSNLETWRKWTKYSRVLAEALEERGFPVAEIEAQERRAEMMERQLQRYEENENVHG